MRTRYASGYDIAQICLSGHVVNHSTIRQPVHNSNYCQTCGAKAISECPSCKLPISGMYWGGSAAYYACPAFCASCGKAYPWTETALKAAKEFAEEQFAEIDRNQLADTIENLARETPRTPLAIARIKKMLEKAGPTASDGFRHIMIDLISETVKKSIWGQ